MAVHTGADDACVQLTTADCTDVVPADAIGTDGVTYLGLMAPVVDEDATEFSALWTRSVWPPSVARPSAETRF